MTEYDLGKKAHLRPEKGRFSLKLPFGRTNPYKDPAAFAGLFDNTHAAVARYIYGISSLTVSEVEDLTAETYERAWKARKRFRGDESAALGWLLTIARRLVIDGHRKQQRRPGSTPLNEQLTHSNDAGPEQQLIGREQRLVLWQLLEALDDRSREILVLRYLVGWQVKQIAAHLGMSDNHVSVTIRRNLDKLRRAWPAAWEEPK